MNAETYNPYTPTESEADAIDRAAVFAAHAALMPLRPLPQPEGNAWTILFLCAFRDARKATKEAEAMLLVERPGHTHVSHYGNQTLAVCGALAFIDLDPQDIHPQSLGGYRIAALIQATKVLEAMANIEGALDGEDEISGTYMAEEACDLAARLTA